MDRNLPAMLRIALQAGKLPHRLALRQISRFLAKILRAEAAPAKFLNTQKLKFVYALRYARISLKISKSALR